MEDENTSRLRFGYMIHRTERMMEREIRGSLNSLGITFSMFHFLRLLMRKDGRTHKEISYEAGLTPSTTASAMKSLEKAGLIRRERSVIDSREIHVYLTDKAIAMRPSMNEISRTANLRATAYLQPEQIRTVHAALALVIQTLEANHQPED